MLFAVIRCASWVQAQPADDMCGGHVRFHFAHLNGVIGKYSCLRFGFILDAGTYIYFSLYLGVRHGCKLSLLCDMVQRHAACNVEDISKSTK